MFKVTILILFSSFIAGSDTGELGVKIERNVPVPMRDGTILRADVYRPDRGGPYPVLVRLAESASSGHFNRFVKAGYIVVSQAGLRWEWASEEEGGLLRRQREIAEDGYDTVEWAAKLSDSNHKVGTFGRSNVADRPWLVAPLCPPSLVAMSARSTGDFRPDHQPTGIIPGVIRNPYSFLRGIFTGFTPRDRRLGNRPGVHTSWEAIRLWDQGEGEKWITFEPRLDIPQDFWGSFSYNIKLNLSGQPLKRPYKTEACKDIAVPNFDIVGWFDRVNHDMALFQTMVNEAKTEVARKGSKIIIGPWLHSRIKRHIGPIDFGPDAVLDEQALVIRWFDYWLKGEENGVDKDAPVRIFVMGDNKWRDEQQWPLQRAKDKILFITSNGQANTPTGGRKLTWQQPEQVGKDQYLYDPKDPVPSIIELRYPFMPVDQRPLAGRKDILVYQTEPLRERVEVTGYPVVGLYASSSAPDTDWFVRLIDVAPDGLAMDVSMGVVRARYRSGFNSPKLLKPGEVVKYSIRMRPTSNAFLPGHRIRIDITSSDFPNYERNHNTAANQNADATLVIANQTIYHGGEHATRIILPWVPNPVEEERQAEEEKPEPVQEKQKYPLHQVAANGDIHKLKMFISKGADVNTKDAEGETPLHYAAEAGKMEVVQLLVEVGADINAGPWTALHSAVDGGRRDIVELLIQRGADINAKDDGGETPLYSAVREGHSDIAELLIQKGADVDLESAAQLGDLAKVKRFIESDPDVNESQLNQLLRRSLNYESLLQGQKDVADYLLNKGANPNAKVKNEATMLHQSAWGGDPARTKSLIEFLVSRGADVNAFQGESRWTPLHSACSRGRGSVAKVLIDNGADVNAKDRWGRTPLHYSLKKEDLDTAELLIAEGSDVNAKDNEGATPLGYALSTNKKDIAGLLLAKGAKITDLGSKDGRGVTALHNATVGGHRDITELLLAKGAKVDETDDNYEFTALHYAARFGRKNVAEVLIANGANIKAKDKWDYQAIHWAAHHDRADVVGLLLSKGADINAKTSLGQTPLELAIPRRNTKTIEVLRKYSDKTETAIGIKDANSNKSYVILERGVVRAVIVNNEPVDDEVLPGHRGGYSGLASLTHRARKENLFVPFYAGLNFEHIHDGTVKPRDILFEPRQAPMETRRIDQNTVELYQKPTPHWQLESWLRYQLLDDGAIEMTLECIPQARTFKNDYIGLFFASYIDKPESLDIHFLGRPANETGAKPRWIRGVTPAHGTLPTHLAVDDNRNFAHDPNFPLTLVFNKSNYRYTEPWYYGVSGGMAFVLMFRPGDNVRLSQSPSGAGNGNPAWDFQWFVPQYKVGQRYRFVMRAMYLPFESRQQIIRATARHRAALERQEWTRFRGPNGQGISGARTIPVKWTQADYNWKVKLPAGGHGSPVLWNDKVFLTCENPEPAGGILLALSVSDGRVLWQKKYKLTAYRSHNDNSYATATPVVDAERVYVLWQTSGETIIAGLDHDGRELWQRTFPGVNSRFGPGTSPVLFDDIVVFTHEQWEGGEGKQGAWIALDRLTGETRWTTKRNNKQISYSTPCIYSPDGREPQLIFASEAHGISGVNPHTGKVIWELDSALPARVVSSPVNAGDLLIGACGKGGAGVQLSAVRPGSSDNPGQASPAYKCTGKTAPYVPTSIAKDGLLFTFHDQGDVSCLRIETGQVLWSEKPGGRFYGSPVWVNGLLYCINRQGNLLVLKAAPAYELPAVNPLGEKSQATPAVAGGKMYLRTYSHLISIGGQAQ